MSNFYWIYLGAVLLLGAVECQVGAGDEKVYRVTSILEAPFLMQDPVDPTNFKGFIADMLNELSKEAQIKYKLQLVKDNRYGALQEDGTWTGMIGELNRKEADIAAAPLTITKQREQVVTFSNPFMIMGVGLLMNRNDVIAAGSGRSQASLFLQPFSWRGWIYIVISFLVVYVTSLLIGRFHPRDGGSPPPKFCCGALYKALVCQAPGMCKRPCALLILLVFTYCFTLVLLSLYTAGLLAIVNRAEADLGPTLRYQTVEDVVNDPEMVLGTLRDSSTADSFAQEKGMDLYERINLRIHSNPHNLVASVPEAVQRVLQGGFAVFEEGKTLEYVTSRNCDLVQIGRIFDHKSYALATTKNSTLKERLDMSLIKLIESQRLLQLEHKWFNQGAEDCPKIDMPKDTSQVIAESSDVVTKDVSSLWGPISFLFVGVGLAWVAVLVDVFRRWRKEGNTTMSKEEKNGSAEEREIMNEDVEV